MGLVNRNWLRILCLAAFWLVHKAIIVGMMDHGGLTRDRFSAFCLFLSFVGTLFSLSFNTFIHSYTFFQEIIFPLVYPCDGLKRFLFNQSKLYHYKDVFEDNTITAHSKKLSRYKKE